MRHAVMLWRRCPYDVQGGFFVCLLRKGTVMENKRNASLENLKKLALTAVFVALAYISLFITPFPKIAGFLTLDLKDAVITLGAMFLGPISAILISLLVSFIEMITISGTGFWGFLMNFLGSAVFAAVASLIYKYKRTLIGGIAGLGGGAVAMVVVMIFSNLFITPIYLGQPRSAVIDLMPVLLSFNSMKAVLNAATVLFLYKPVSNALKAARIIEKRENEKLTIDIRTLIVMACALIIATGSVLILLFAI
jgi:riboflavin transporter FmnP